jgi:hypothetical protein
MCCKCTCLSGSHKERVDTVVQKEDADLGTVHLWLQGMAYPRGPGPIGAGLDGRGGPALSLDPVLPGHIRSLPGPDEKPTQTPDLSNLCW